MSQTTLLTNGCPCTSTDCGNKGNCAACIKHHVEKAISPTSCMKSVVESMIQKALEEK